MAQNGSRRTRSSNNSTPTNAGGTSANGGHSSERYEDIMGLVADDPALDSEQKINKATEALSERLSHFRKWLTSDANVTIHPAVCIVNGEATDGTKNAPLLAFEMPTEEEKAGEDTGDSRLGRVDGEGDQALYDKSMGCQIRTTREIKADDTMMVIPRTSMITPDSVASSNAGRAVLACCKATKPKGGMGFWDAFTNTTEYESKFSMKSTGPQSLMKILQERKKVEAAVAQRIRPSSSPKLRPCLLVLRCWPF